MSREEFFDCYPNIKPTKITIREFGSVTGVEDLVIDVGILMVAYGHPPVLSAGFIVGSVASLDMKKNITPRRVFFYMRGSYGWIYSLDFFDWRRKF